MPALRNRLLRTLVCCTFLPALLPIPAAAILCEIFAPCVHAGAGRVVFIGTVKKVVEEQRGDWEQPELVAYFRVDERLSKSDRTISKPALLSSGFYEVGKSYLIVAVPWRDGVSVEWRGDDYRGFQTTLVCGPAFPMEEPSTQQYVDHFRKALKGKGPMDYSVSVHDESYVDSKELPGALVHLIGKRGSYWATTDAHGDAEFQSVLPGVYRWEVWDGNRRFDPNKETSPTIEVVRGQCSHTWLGVLPKR